MQFVDGVTTPNFAAPDVAGLAAAGMMAELRDLWAWVNFLASNSRNPIHSLLMQEKVNCSTESLYAKPDVTPLTVQLLKRKTGDVTAKIWGLRTAQNIQPIND